MHWITRPGWPGTLIALLAGAITPLALAPYDLWPLAILSIALFYLGLRDLTPRQATLRGWSYGFGLFAAGTSWVYVSIHDYGAASPPLAVFLTLLFVGGLGLLFALSAWVWTRWLRRVEAPLPTPSPSPHCGWRRKPSAAGFSPASPGCMPATASSTARWPAWPRWAACGCCRLPWR